MGGNIGLKNWAGCGIMGAECERFFWDEKMEEEIISQLAGESEQGQDKFSKLNLLESSEGRILLWGVGLAFAFVLWLGVQLLVSPKYAQVIIAMTATHFMFGRAASMAFGYSMELGHGTVIPLCMVCEAMMVLIIYPLFVFSWRHLLVINGLKKIFERTRQVAEARKDWVRKYGIAGLFAFVWIPFWMTGPVVGSVIGFLLGLRNWVNMVVVLAGTFVAILGWGVLLRQFNEKLAAYSPYATMMLVAFLIVIVVVGHLLSRTRGGEK